LSYGRKSDFFFLGYRIETVVPDILYRKSSKSLYVTINGARYNLDADKKEAKDKFHKLMASPSVKLKNDSAAAVLDDFLTWSEENRAKQTFERYRDFIQAFADARVRDNLISARGRRSRPARIISGRRAIVFGRNSRTALMQLALAAGTKRSNCAKCDC
jgi:hypothetical protein